MCLDPCLKASVNGKFAKDFARVFVESIKREKLQKKKESGVE